MNDTQRIEKHVAKRFLERTKNIKVCDDDLILGDHIKKEPDILYNQDMGIEIGAVVFEINNRIDKNEKNFFSKASENIIGRIPETIQVRLVMQDDNNTVKHKPTAHFKSYKYLPNFLDGIFVFQYKNVRVNYQIILNQKTGIRTCTFPNINKNKDFLGFMNELVYYINSLTQSDFYHQEDIGIHHVEVAERIIKNKFFYQIKILFIKLFIYVHSLILVEFGQKKVNRIIKKNISQKIIDKLAKNKYSGYYKHQILLLHNYSISGDTEDTTNNHFYIHYRDEIFNFLLQNIKRYQSFNIYNGIYFLDFSNYNLNNNFDLIDFKNYSLTRPSKFLNGFGEIRVI